MKQKTAPLARASALASLMVLAGGAASAATHDFQVFANTHSTAFNSHDASPLDTGLVFDAGDTLDISASGTWNGGGCGNVGPTGTTCFGNDPVTGFNYFSLVGRVGNGAYFRVGDSYVGTANASGHLFLAFLDTDSFNNSGFVTATVSAVPEPASVALLLAGLAAVGGVARRRA